MFFVGVSYLSSRQDCEKVDMMTILMSPDMCWSDKSQLDPVAWMGWVFVAYAACLTAYVEMQPSNVCFEHQVFVGEMRPMCPGCCEVGGFSTMKCWRDGEDALHGLWMRFGVEDPRFVSLTTRALKTSKMVTWNKLSAALVPHSTIRKVSWTWLVAEWLGGFSWISCSSLTVDYNQ